MLRITKSLSERLQPAFFAAADARFAPRVASECTAAGFSWEPQVAAAARSLGSIRNHTASATASPPSAAASLDPREAAKFAALSASWWDTSGPFAPLHRFNPARCKFLRMAVCSAHGLPYDQPQPLKGLHALDVGCGGGILAESLARMGATVHAIDITEENVRAAQQHALLDPSIHKRIRYECVPAEALLERSERYDLVMASEVIEHVRRPEQFVQVLSQLMTLAQDHVSEPEERQGSSLLVMSTLNRTLPSYAVAIVAAEHITGAVPLGTHDWRRFITPQEMTLMASQAGLEAKMMAGIGLSVGGGMTLTDDTSINYIASFGRKYADVHVSTLEACNIAQ